jgi:hypothetical protein
MSDYLHCDRHELLVALQPQEIKLIARPFEFSETGGLFLSWARSPSLRALAPAQIGARPPTENCNRVPRNRRIQHIDVGGSP